MIKKTIFVVIINLLVSSVFAENPVYFADPNLKAAVEAYLCKSNPTPTDMLKLDMLRGTGKGISDLTGIQYATNLQMAYLNDNQISDLSLLSGLGKLGYLNLSNNKISDCIPLSSLKKLGVLLLRDNLISDLSPLPVMPEFGGLYLSGNLITDLTPLSGRTFGILELSNNNLRYIRVLSQCNIVFELYLSNTQISDLSPLSGLTNLFLLHAANNRISDISALAGMWRLDSVIFAGNQISDISALTGHVYLHYVDISDNWIRDIKPISGWQFTNYEYLDMRMNQLDDAAYNTYIPSIINKNPGIKIYYDEYTSIKYTLELSSTLGGHVSTPGEGIFTYIPDSVVPIVAQSEGDADFTKWTGTAVNAGKVADPYNETTTVTVDANYTICANFNTPSYEKPDVLTMSASNVKPTSAVLWGKILDNGGELCSWRFLYTKQGKEESPVITDWQTDLNEDQTFSTTISGLEPNSFYLFYAQASNSAGMVNGNMLNFKTIIDPNAAPIAFNPNEPNTLLIQNFIKVFQNDPNKPHNKQGLLTYIEKPGNSNGIDFNDVLYSTDEAMSSKIVSLIQVVNLQEQITDFIEISKDARPDNAQDSLFELSIYSLLPNESNVNSENYLKFWLANNAFKGKPVTIQQVSLDPNIVYSVWDVNQIINKNGKKMPFNNLVDQKPNVPYAWFVISTNRKILDINDDRIIDLNDYSLLLEDLGKEGIFRSDIASIKNNSIILGIPDGKVNEIDENAFITEYNKKYPDNPIVKPQGFSEGFKSGQIQEPFITSETYPWIISTDSYEGNYCVKSGNIGNNKSSTLEATVNSPTGKISFWRKVSSESGWDELIFYIDGIKKESWSGLLDWQEMTYTITPGTHTLKWEYKKDRSSSDGEDAAWIDEINIF